MPLHLNLRPAANRLFDDDYEVVLADTEASRSIHCKIRYQVYCLERGFENPTDFPDGEEHDRWDVHAAPFIVRQRDSGVCVAALRLVLPYAASFPLETLNCLTPGHADHIQRRQLGEISRICVIRSPNPHCRNPHLDDNFGHVVPERESQVMLGLFRAVMVYGLERGIEYCYLLVTPAFARLLRRIGVQLYAVGTATEHHGLRAPYLIGLRESAASSCSRSAAVHSLCSRAVHAYQRYSVLDDTARYTPMIQHSLSPRQDGTTATRPYSYRYRGTSAPISQMQAR